MATKVVLDPDKDYGTCESLILIQMPLKSTIKILRETLPPNEKVWNS